MTAHTAASIRQLEQTSIREFVESCADLFTGIVLDYGAGRMPYASIVEAAGGEYVAWDREGLPGNVSGEDFGPDLPPGNLTAILCTQVIQYVPDPAETFLKMRYALLDRSGVLVMTGPTCWPEVEREDLHRFTQAGIRWLLMEAGFMVERLEERAGVEVGGFRFPLGWGVVARA